MGVEPGGSRSVDTAAAVQAIEDIFGNFVRCLHSRNVEDAVRSFADDVIWFGSAAHERAYGLVELRRFLSDDVFKRPYTFEWSWERPWIGLAGQVAWFVTPATALVHYVDGRQEELAYRMSGVIEHVGDGRWVVRLFNGSEPALPAAEPASDR